MYEKSLMETYQIVSKFQSINFKKEFKQTFPAWMDNAATRRHDYLKKITE